MSKTAIGIEIIEKIKKLGDARTGTALLDMMDYYGVIRLADISQEQAESYYNMRTGGEIKRIK